MVGLADTGWHSVRGSFDGQPKSVVNGSMSDTYLVWSHEHGAWWGPARCGYERKLSQAGRYSHAEALDICTRAIPGTSRALRTFPELPVREADALMIRDRFLGEYPSEADTL